MEPVVVELGGGKGMDYCPTNLDDELIKQKRILLDKNAVGIHKYRTV